MVTTMSTAPNIKTISMLVSDQLSIIISVSAISSASFMVCSFHFFCWSRWLLYFFCHFSSWVSQYLCISSWVWLMWGSCLFWLMLWRSYWLWLRLICSWVISWSIWLNFRISIFNIFKIIREFEIVTKLIVWINFKFQLNFSRLKLFYLISRQLSRLN